LFWDKGGRQAASQEKIKTEGQALRLPGTILYMLVRNTNEAAIPAADMIPVGCRRCSLKQKRRDSTEGKKHEDLFYRVLRHFLQVPYSTVLRALI
jgi:hypothetical protein